MIRGVHYELEIDITRSTPYAVITGRVSGFATSSSNEVTFSITENAKIVSAQCAGVPVQWTRTSPSEVLSQHLDRLSGVTVFLKGNAADPPPTQALEIRYRLPLRSMKRGRSIYFDIYAAWYPLLEPMSKITFDLRVVHPTGMIVCGNGNVSCQTLDGHQVTSVASPSPQIDICLAVLVGSSRLSKSEGSVSGSIYFWNSGEAVADQILTQALAVTTSFERWFERPSPRTITLILREEPGSAYSRTAYIILSRQRMSSASSGDLCMQNIRLIAHEIAHWWTDAVAPVGRSKWLSEGLAEYCALYYLTKRAADRAMSDFLLQARIRLTELRRFPPTSVIQEHSPGYYDQIYTRGAVMVWMIAAYGEIQTLLKALDTLVTNPYCYITDAEAFPGFEAACGTRIPLVLDEWICRSGLPHFVIDVRRRCGVLGGSGCSLRVFQPGPVYHASVQFALVDSTHHTLIEFPLVDAETVYDVTLPYAPTLAVVEPADRCIFTCEFCSPIGSVETLAGKVRSARDSSIPCCSLLTFAGLCEYMRSVEPGADWKDYLKELISIAPLGSEWLWRWAMTELEDDTYESEETEWKAS